MAKLKGGAQYTSVKLGLILDRLGEILELQRVIEADIELITKHVGRMSTRQIAPPTLEPLGKGPLT